MKRHNSPPRIGNTLAAAAVASLLSGGITDASAAGVYVGGGLGQAKYVNAGLVENICGEYGYTCSVEDTDTGFLAYAGYRFGEFIAVEAGYASLGETTATLPQTISVTADIQGATISVVPTVPLSKYLSLFGKAGIFIWHTALEAKSAVLGLSATADGAGVDATFGAGVAVHFNDHLTLRLEWDRYNIDDDLNVDGNEVNVTTDIDLLSAGVALRF